jgi:thymidine kinase
MNTHQQQNGYLEIILGPMFSSKTSRLIEVYKQCIFCNIPVTVFNHILDRRYHTTLLSNHDNVMVPCVQLGELKDQWLNEGKNSDVILINEGQFFPDLVDAVKQMLDLKKKIFVCGLDGDFERKKFGQILDLIPLCDEVSKQHSLCSLCKDGSAAIFSMRLTEEKQQTLVGSSNYIPVCRSCYDTKKS